MKTLGTAILIAILLILPAMAQEQNNLNTTVPKELVGYVIYDTVDRNGNTVTAKAPVKYTLKTISHTDNDESYEYRHYRIEMARVQKEKAEKDKIENEAKRINSAAYYPLYFD
jgi:hypothetical protein